MHSQSHLLTAPYKQPQQAWLCYHSLRMKITDRTLKLDRTPWRMIQPQKSDNDWCLLWLQGFLSTIEGHTERLGELATATNTASAILNYAGHGNHLVKIEDATRRQQLGQVIGVYDELAKMGYSKFIIYGGSFGAYMAALLAGQRTAESLILRVPAYYPESEFDTPFRDTISATRYSDQLFYTDVVAKGDPNHAIKSVSQFKGYTYIMEHAQDEVIHPSVPRAYFEAAKYGNYIIIPGAPHSPKTTPNPQFYYNMIYGWLETIINTTKF